ncbi:MAG: hypothetical protein AAF975_06620, partial [Spirochaetota bacterium]
VKLSGFAEPSVAMAISGAASLEAKDCEAENLNLTMAGASRLEAEDFAVENLKLKMTGASELRGLMAVNAQVDSSGASTSALEMEGGILEGSLSGSSALHYRGRVSAENVKTSGAGTVSFRG